MRASAEAMDLDSPREASSRTDTPVDLAHLRRYTLGNRPLELEILDLFLAQAPTTIDRLSTAAGEKQWREAAHTLKGSARAIGAWRLAEAAETGEAIAGWEKPEAGRKAIAEICAAYDRVHAFIRGLHAA